MGRTVRTAVAAAIGGGAIVAALTGCSGAAPAGPGASTTAAPSVSAGDAELIRFTEVAQRVVRDEHAPSGMDFVRALERAGYARTALQVTADRTSVGLAVPSVQFAARSARSCLIGQFGDAGLQVQRAEPVDGVCLIGETRALG